MFIHPATLYARKAVEQDTTTTEPANQVFAQTGVSKQPAAFAIVTPSSFQEGSVQFRCKDQFSLYYELATRIYAAHALNVHQQSQKKTHREDQLRQAILELSQPQLKKMYGFASGWRFVGNRQQLLCLERDDVTLHAELANVRSTLLPPHQQPSSYPLVDIRLHPIRRFALGKNRSAIISSHGGPKRGWTVFLNVHSRHAPQLYARLLSLLETSRMKFLCSFPIETVNPQSKFFTQLYIEEQDLMHVIGHTKILLQNGWLENTVFPQTTRIAAGISIRRIANSIQPSGHPISYASAFQQTEKMLRAWQQHTQADQGNEMQLF